MDPIIEAMVQKVLTFRHTSVPVAQLRSWVEHLRDVVQPQLDELEELKEPDPDLIGPLRRQFEDIAKTNPAVAANLAKDKAKTAKKTS